MFGFVYAVFTDIWRTLSAFSCFSIYIYAALIYRSTMTLRSLATATLSLSALRNTFRHSLPCFLLYINASSIHWSTYHAPWLRQHCACALRGVHFLHFHPCFFLHIYAASICWSSMSICSLFIGYDDTFCCALRITCLAPSSCFSYTSFPFLSLEHRVTYVHLVRRHLLWALRGRHFPLIPRPETSGFFYGAPSGFCYSNSLCFTILK